MSTLATAPALQPNAALSNAVLVSPTLAVGSILLPHKPRILLLSDDQERSQRLRRSLGYDQAEFIIVTSLAELPAALSRNTANGYAFVVLDFAAAQVKEALTLLRTAPLTQTTPILVEADRLGDALPLAGVLPQYRAMACAWHELLALAQQKLQKPRPIAEPLQHLL